MRHTRLRGSVGYCLNYPPEAWAPSGSDSCEGRPLPDTTPTDDIETPSQREVVQLLLLGVGSQTLTSWRGL